VPPIPSLHVTTDAFTQLDVDALLVPVFRGGIEGPGAEQALRAIGLPEIPRDRGFRGKVGEVLHLAAPGQPWGRVTLVGLGRLDALSDEQVRRATGAAIRDLATSARTVATTMALANPAVSTLRAAAEGAVLGAYRYDEFLGDAPPLRVTDVTFAIPSSLASSAQDALARATIHARAQRVAAELVSRPPNLCGPVEVAAAARDLLPDDVEVEVWDEDRLADEGCGGLLAVARGSARPPRLVRLRYAPADPVARVSLVGKGITFDSGGISLKRPSSIMEHMKGDMGGAAVVFGVIERMTDARGVGAAERWTGCPGAGGRGPAPAEGR
jgi:leucyl aminopeptidase